jgi:hypothetical protein
MTRSEILAEAKLWFSLTGGTLRENGCRVQMIHDAEAAVPPDKRAQFRQRLSARLALDHRHRWTDTEMAEAAHQRALLEPDANEGDDNGGG